MTQSNDRTGESVAVSPVILSTKANPYVITFDGGADPNPGAGYGSFHIVNPLGRTIIERLDFSRSGEVLTNNQAEYRTLIAALDRLRTMLGDRAPLEHVRIDGDSQLVINQVRGTWKVRQPDLLPLRDRVLELANSFGSVDFHWHRRSNSVRILGH